MPFGEYIAEGLKSALCTILQGAEVLEDTFREVLDPNDPGYGYRARLIYSRFCDPSPPPPPRDPPFEGGQCEFCYSLTVTRTIIDSGVPGGDGQDSITQSVFGPISFSGIEEINIAPGVSRFESVFFTHGICNLPRSESPVRTVITADNADEDAIVTIDNISAVPQSGGPDDCGSPPPELPPTDPNNRRFPIDLDFEYNDGTDFFIDGDVFFGFAYFDNDFNLNIPLKFVLENNVRFNANFNFNSGDVNINFGDDYDYPTPLPPEGDYRPDPDSPPPPPTTVPPPPDFQPPFPPNEDPDAEDSEDFDSEEPQENPKIRRMIGVLVDTVVVPTVPTELNQDVNPDVYVPDIGLVNFAYNIGGTRLYWGEDIRVKNRRQVIFTPSGRYAVAVSGTIRQGGEWVLTPIYQNVVEGVGVV